MSARPAGRLVGSLAALLLAVSIPALVIVEPVSAAAGGGPVAIDTHNADHAPDVWNLTSSAAGTLFTSSRSGTEHIYFRPAPMAAGTADQDFGPNPYFSDVASIVADKIVLPAVRGEHLSAIRWCTAGSCRPPFAARIPLDGAETFLANTGTGILVYAGDDTGELLLKRFAGGTQRLGRLPFPADGWLSAAADAKGAVLLAWSDVFYVSFADASITALQNEELQPPEGGALTANEVALSPRFLATQLPLPDGGTVIKRIPRDELTAMPDSFAVPFDSIDKLRITDTSTAWVAPSGAGTSLFTRPVGSSTTGEYPYESYSGPATYETTGDWLVADESADRPGFYRVSPGAQTGTFVATLGAQRARTNGLALSHNRVLYSDDSGADFPLFLRDLSNLPSLGQEREISPATEGAFAQDLSGPFVAFTRPDPYPPQRTQLVYGRAGRPLKTLPLPVGERIAEVQVSGSRALLRGRSSHRLVDLLTGAVTVVPAHVYPRLWGDYLVTLDVQTLLLQRRNLVSGAVATIVPADPACPQPCIANDGDQDVEVYGDQVVYHLQTPSGGLRTGVWTATSATTGTTEPLPVAEDYNVSMAMSDGLLFVERQGQVTLYDLRAGTNVRVASGYQPAVDGYRLGWVAATDLRGRVADVRHYLPDYTLSAPRMLTAAAPARFVANNDGTQRWRPHFYSTRDVDWTLDVHSGAATGPILRSFSGRSRLGEIYLSEGWDGTDSAGEPVPEGSYTWTLTGSADGVELIMSDGQSVLTGTVHVSRS